MSFIPIQHGHGIQATGYEVQPIRTGGERVLAYRMGEQFAQVADEPGEVTEVSEHHVAVKFKSGDVKKFPIGPLFITSSGSTYPNNLATTAPKVGHKYQKGDVVTYNTGFFRKNPLSPNKVDYMSGVLAVTALREASYTLEDSASISGALSERMKTQSTKVHYVRVRFDQSLHKLVKVGDDVELGSRLCVIEDDVSASAGLFDEETRATLELVSTRAPKSKVAGKVSNMEVFYRGDIDMMGAGLSKTIKSIERVKKAKAAALERDYIANEIDTDVRIGGHSLNLEELVLAIYVDHDIPMGIGDKLVFGNQAKSTVGEVLSGNTRTLDGRVVDSIFGAKSFIDRIILSPFKNGLTNSFLINVGELAADMYFGEEKKK